MTGHGGDEGARSQDRAIGSKDQGRIQATETGDPHAKEETGRTEEDQSARMALNEAGIKHTAKG